MQGGGFAGLGLRVQALGSEEVGLQERIGGVACKQGVRKSAVQGEGVGGEGRTHLVRSWRRRSPPGAGGGVEGALE